MRWVQAMAARTSNACLASSFSFPLPFLVLNWPLHGRHRHFRIIGIGDYPLPVPILGNYAFRGHTGGDLVWLESCPFDFWFTPRIGSHFWLGVVARVLEPLHLRNSRNQWTWRATSPTSVQNAAVWLRPLSVSPVFCFLAFGPDRCCFALYSALQHSRLY